MAFENTVKLVLVWDGTATRPAVQVVNSDTLGSETHILNGWPLEIQTQKNVSLDGGISQVVFYE